jgi:phage FluMu gp28-like protein
MEDVKELQTADYFPVNEAVLLPYQARWVEDTAEVKIGEKSRRTGLTWAEASDNVITAAKPKKRGGRNVFYVGSRQEMALEYISACALFAKAFNQLAGQVSESLFQDEDGQKEILTYTIRFPNSGFKISALSSRPSNLRGMQGDVVIDEAAFHDSLHELLKAAMALTMWGARVRIISTHNGVDNEYNHYLEDARAGRKPYSVHRITLDDALADGLFKRICFVNGKEWTPEAEAAWRTKTIANAPSKEAADEEYFCIPSQSGGAYLSRLIIENAMFDAPVIRYTGTAEFNALPEHIRIAELNDWLEEEVKPLLAKLNTELQHCLGEDFARSGDLTVMLPMAVEQNLDRTVPFIVELKNLPFKNQEQILFYIIDRLPRFTAAALDARGNGQYLAEQAGYKYGSCISQVMLTQSFYLENFPKLKAAFEDETLKIPKDADVLNDLRAVQSVGGIPKVPDVKTGEQKDRHGDVAIALLMAWFASLMDFIEYRYIPVKTPLKPDADRPQRSVRSNNGGFANSKGQW